MDNAKPPENCASIEDVRQGINALDREVIALIGQRSRYVEAAAKFKTSTSDVQAPARQQAMLEERRRWAEEERISPDVIEKLYRDLIGYFIGREMESWKSTE